MVVGKRCNAIVKSALDDLPSNASCKEKRSAELADGEHDDNLRSSNNSALPRAMTTDGQKKRGRTYKVAYPSEFASNGEASSKRSSFGQA